MRTGVVVASSWKAEDIINAGELADSAGLDYFFVTDHYLTPSSNSTVDAWTLLAALAVRTERVKLGTCVTPIPFRHPAMLAKIVATVDRLSKGRVMLGVGAGWHEPEFLAYTGEWERTPAIRVSKALEGLNLMQRLWSEDKPFDFQGKFYSLKGALLEPKPTQGPSVPLWFGGVGRRMLKCAARVAQGWLPPVPGMTESEYRKVASTLRCEENRIGRAEPVVMGFNGTIEELEANFNNFSRRGFGCALLTKTKINELSPAIRRLEASL